MKKLFILLIFQTVYSQKENTFADYTATDSISSFHIYGEDQKPEKSYLLRHSKIKDTISKGVFYSNFNLNDGSNNYNYWIGIKGKTYYFFKDDDKTIDSVSILDVDKNIRIQTFNKFYTIKVKQIIDKKNNYKLILDFKRKRKKMFKNFNLFRMIIEPNNGPFLIFKDKKYNLQTI